MTILIGIISFWAAICFIIAVIAYFDKGDNKFRQYDLKTSLVIGGYFFIAPIFIPYVRWQERKYKNRQNKIKG